MKFSVELPVENSAMFPFSLSGHLCVNIGIETCHNRARNCGQVRVRIVGNIGVERDQSIQVDIGTSLGQLENREGPTQRYFGTAAFIFGRQLFVALLQPKRIKLVFRY